MRIIITENQYGRLFEQKEIPCVPTADTKYYEVDVTIYDIMNNGVILHYGEEDDNNMGAIKRIQDKLGIGVDGKYGPTMLGTLSTTLGIDLCKQKNNDIPIGPNGLTKLGLFDVTMPKENTEDYVNYILASTLVGECTGCKEDELFAIYSTIKHRSKGSMVDAALKPKQYSTWNRYNKSKDKKEFLVTRISEQKRKGFDEMLSTVKGFRNKSPLKYNHYFTNTLAKKAREGTFNDDVAESYRNNIKSAKKIGNHTFWWDKRHK